MKKLLIVLACSFLTNVYAAEIPYCSGSDAKGGKGDALQRVVHQFANKHNCDIGTNCLLNFNKVNYSIAWAKDCPDSAKKGNSAQGSTFTCEMGVCTPLGFKFPRETY